MQFSVQDLLLQHVHNDHNKQLRLIQLWGLQKFFQVPVF